MSKPPKPDLKALISGEVAPNVSGEAEAVVPRDLAPQQAEQAPPTSTAAVVTLRNRRMTPKGKGTLKERTRQMSVYLEEPVYDQLREIAHIERTKLHPLILEGIDLLLKKRGSPSINELIRKAG